MSDENLDDYSGILNKLRMHLLEYYEPVQHPKNADFHLSTSELYSQLYALIPCDGLTGDLIAQWMHIGGFSFWDYGEMKFEWMMKRKG